MLTLNKAFRPSVKTFGTVPTIRETVVELDETIAAAATGLIRVRRGDEVAVYPAASILYLLWNGFKQSVADSSTSAKKLADWEGLTDKRLDALRDGKMVASEREGGGPVDPFEYECNRIARAKVEAIAAKKGKVLPKKDSPEFKAILLAYRNGPKKDWIEAEARKRLAENAEVGDDDDIDFEGATVAATPAPESVAQEPEATEAPTEAEAGEIIDPDGEPKAAKRGKR